MEPVREEQNEGLRIDIIDLLRALLHKAWIIVAAAIIVAIGAYIYSRFFITPMYKSTTAMYVIGKESTANVSYADTQMAVQILNDYKELIVSKPVLEAVIEDCNLSMSPGGLKGSISIANTENTRVLYLSVTHSSPEKAQEIANSLREQSKKQIKEVLEVTAVNTVQEADLPTGKSSPDITRWVLIGGFAGAVLSALVLAIIYLMDNTIKSAEDVERYLGWGTLAMIPSYDADNTESHRRHTKTSAKNKGTVRAKEGTYHAKG